MLLFLNTNDTNNKCEKHMSFVKYIHHAQGCTFYKHDIIFVNLKLRIIYTIVNYVLRLHTKSLVGIGRESYCVSKFNLEYNIIYHYVFVYNNAQITFL